MLINYIASFAQSFDVNSEESLLSSINKILYLRESITSVIFSDENGFFIVAIVEVGKMFISISFSSLY